MGSLVQLGNHAQFRNGANFVSNRLILDQLSVPSAAAFSLRLLRAEYTGFCIRVRRSNDNAELNIGFTVFGVLDNVALLEFTGANSGFVVTWYDQSGNGRNATQATAKSQPRIVNAGVVETINSIPTLDFGFSGPSGLSITFNQSGSTALTLNTVYKLQNATFGIGAGSLNTISDSTTSRVGLRPFNIDSLGPVLSSNAGDLSGLGTQTTSATVVTVVIDSLSSIYQNGVLLQTRSLPLNSIPTTHVIGARFSLTDNWLVGKIPEYLVFFSALSTTSRQSLERSQGTAFNVTVA